MKDLIDRQAAIDAVCKNCYYDREEDYKDCKYYRDKYSTFCDDIYNLRHIPSGRSERSTIDNWVEELFSFIQKIYKQGYKDAVIDKKFKELSVEKCKNDLINEMRKYLTGCESYDDGLEMAITIIELYFSGKCLSSLPFFYEEKIGKK